MDKYQLEEDLALGNVNYVQEIFKNIKRSINLMKADLGKAGFKVEFEEKTMGFSCREVAVGGVLEDSPIMKLVPWDEKKITFCKISKKNSDDVVVKTKAEVAEGDLNIELLGEYLSLARATRIVLGDYNDN